MTSSPSSPHVLIIGGGVIGLSLAISLLDHPLSHPYRVTLIAADLPVNAPGSDSHPASYASAWAGAHHVSAPISAREKRWDQTTFQTLVEMQRRSSDSAAAHGQPPSLVWVKQTELFEARLGGQDVDPLGDLEWYPEFKRFEASTLPRGFSHGASFATLDLNVPVYLCSLLSRFLALGGRVLHQKVSSVSEAMSLASSRTTLGLVGPRGEQSKMDWEKPSSCVVAVGLGAKDLAEVRDDKVYPLRGQVLLLDTPHLDARDLKAREDATSGVTTSTSSIAPLGSRQRPIPGGVSVCNAQGFRDAYVIPRGDGNCIAGGTRLADVWDPVPNDATTSEILTRIGSIEPALLRDVLQDQAPRVLGANVGLRPGRRGGPRVGRAKKGELKDGMVEGAHVVWCYGFGGSGYQNSWGVAFETRETLDQLHGLQSAGVGAPGLRSLGQERPSKL